MDNFLYWLSILYAFGGLLFGIWFIGDISQFKCFILSHNLKQHFLMMLSFGPIYTIIVLCALILMYVYKCWKSIYDKLSD